MKHLQFVCYKPTLGFKISLRQMAKENHLNVEILSKRGFELSGKTSDLEHLRQSRGWKQAVELSEVRQGEV